MTKQASGSGSKGSKVVVPSRQSQWEDHNPNSTRRKDLTPVEKQLQKIEILRSLGVPEAELTRIHVVPVDKQNQDQGGVIDTSNAVGSNIITCWAHDRRTYYHLLIFGKGSPQAKGEMHYIRDYIEDQYKPQLANVHAQIKRAGGRAFYPPYCFDVDVDDLVVPVPPRRRRH